MVQARAIQKFSEWMAVASAVFITLAASASSASAERARPYELLSPKADAIAESTTLDCPKGMNDAVFTRLLLEYPSVYHDPSKNLILWDLDSRITKAVFCQVGTTEYVSFLKDLETRAPKDQDAYYNLAKRLQAHWQTQYAIGLSKVQHQRTNKVTNDSRMLSLVATALGLFGKTSQVPTYFGIVKHLFPILVPMIATESTKLFNHYGMFDKKYPLSPAHVMNLPLPAENDQYDSFEVVRNLISASASVAGAQLAVQAVKYFEIGMDVGKASFNPVTILASVVVGQAVQEITTYEIDEYHYRTLLKSMLQHRDEIIRALQARDYMKMRTAADNFKTTTVMLSSFLDRESLNVWVDFDSTAHAAKSDPKWKTIVGAALEFYTNSTPEYFFPDAEYRKKEIQDASVKRDRMLEAIESAQDPISLQDVQLAIALKVLETGLDNVTYLTGEQKVQADLIAKGYPLYLESQSPVLADSPKAVNAYMTALETNKDTVLFNELLKGETHRNPTHLLLQAASFLRSLNQTALESTVDDLLSILYSSELLK